MESAATLAASAAIKQRIYSQELIPTFLQYADKIQVLSLDCFDTVLWRKTVIPSDVFYALQHKPTFKKYGINAVHRIDSEGSARRAMLVDHSSEEVTLEQVFSTQFKRVSSDDVMQLMNEEVETEIEFCFGYPPVLELMRAAHARGIKIIIVSNTYLIESQLRKLLKANLPADVYASISKVFCSCEFNRPKEKGLFQDVLQKLNIAPEKILHIGDNFTADLAAARAFGLHALNLVQFNEKTEEILRMHSATASLIDPMIRYQRPQCNIFRGVFAMHALDIQRAEQIIGYFSLGPIAYAFACYLQAEIAELQRNGQRPKVLFLMRDAHLFSLAVRELLGESLGHDVRISRFTAIASSFRNKNNIREYLAKNINTWDFPSLSKQLMLTQNMIDAAAIAIKAAPRPTHAFCQYVLQDHIVKHIVQRSEAYRIRLKKYLQKNTNIEPGDTIVLVDIGYIGRTQDVITPFFLESMGASEVTGRYLMLMNTPETHYSRSGFVDCQLLDTRAIKMLCESGYLFEELCCNADNSVSDFDEEGNPIYSNSSVGEAQRLKVRAIHAECMRFIRDAKQFFQQTQMDVSMQLLRDSAVAEMARRVFLPTATEIDYLNDFLHDVDGGSEEFFSAFKDPLHEVNNLRRQGLIFDGQHPYGVRSAGFELVYTMMSLKRFRFGSTTQDMNFRREPIKIAVRENNAVQEFFVEAALTYDGYYSLLLPVKTAGVQVAVMFGVTYQFIQLHCVELVVAKKLLDKEEHDYREDILPKVFFNQMIDRGDRLYECASPASALMAVLASEKFKSEGLVCRIVFRPVVKRSEQRL